MVKYSRGDILMFNGKQPYFVEFHSSSNEYAFNAVFLTLNDACRVALDKFGQSDTFISARFIKVGDRGRQIWKLL